MRNRDQLHQYYFQTCNPTDWLNYRNARNSVKSMLRQSEKQCIGNQISKCKSNSGALWKVINQTLSRKENSKPTYAKETKKLAEEFNHYVATIGEKTAQAVKQLSLDNNLQPYIHNQPPAATEYNRPIRFDFVAVSEDEISRIIMSMPTNKSAGPDKINMCIIRDSQLPYILTPLTNIINSSLSSNPEAWKLAEVIPILKEGDHEQVPNNRLISLLQILSKICEKAVLNQLSSYLHQHSILSPRQSGNNETLNVYITDNILKSMDEMKVTALVLIDLSKAFDSISHEMFKKVAVSRLLVYLKLPYNGSKVS